MKRFIASVLLLVMVTTPILTMSGCATKNDTTLSMGEWLTMVNSAFGMESYTSEEPYFKDDFSDVQTEATDSIFSSAEAKADAEAIRKRAEAQGGTYTTVTSGEVDLHFDVCFNVAVFFILKIEVTDTSYVAEILGE